MFQTAPRTEECGHCDLVYVDEIGETPVVVFKQGSISTCINCMFLHAHCSSVPIIVFSSSESPSDWFCVVCCEYTANLKSAFIVALRFRSNKFLIFNQRLHTKWQGKKDSFGLSSPDNQPLSFVISQVDKAHQWLSCVQRSAKVCYFWTFSCWLVSVLIFIPACNVHQSLFTSRVVIPQIQVKKCISHV